MKADVQMSLEYACAVVAVYRSLAAEKKGRKITFGNLAKAIGLWAHDEQFKPGEHGVQLGKILDIVAAVQSYVGSDPELGEFSSKRFLETADGKSGSDADKIAKIVIEYPHGISN